MSKIKSIWNKYMLPPIIKQSLIDQMIGVSGIDLEFRWENQGREVRIFDKDLRKEIGRVSRYDLRGGAYTACMKIIMPYMSLRHIQNERKELTLVKDIELNTDRTGLGVVQMMGSDYMTAGPLYIDLAHIRAIKGDLFWLEGVADPFETPNAHKLLGIWLEWKQKRIFKPPSEGKL